MKKLPFLVPLIVCLTATLLPSTIVAAKSSPPTTVFVVVTYKQAGALSEDIKYQGQSYNAPYCHVPAKNLPFPQQVDVNSPMTIRFYRNAKHCSGNPSYTLPLRSIPDVSATLKEKSITVPSQCSCTVKVYNKQYFDTL